MRLVWRVQYSLQPWASRGLRYARTVPWRSASTAGASDCPTPPVQSSSCVAPLHVCVAELHVHLSLAGLSSTSYSTFLLPQGLCGCCWRPPSAVAAAVAAIRAAGARCRCAIRARCRFGGRSWGCCRPAAPPAAPAVPVPMGTDVCAHWLRDEHIEVKMVVRVCELPSRGVESGVIEEVPILPSVT